MDCHTILTNWCPHLCYLHHFYARYPFWHNHPNISWLRTGTKYVSLHTWWLYKSIETAPTNNSSLSTILLLFFPCFQSHRITILPDIFQMNIGYPDPSTFLLHLSQKRIFGNKWHRFFIGNMSFLWHNQQCQSTPTSKSRLMASSILHPPQDSWGKGRFTSTFSCKYPKWLNNNIRKTNKQDVIRCHIIDKQTS